MYRLRLLSSLVLSVLLGILHISVGIVARLRDVDPGFGSQQEQKIFLFSEVSRPALGHTQLHIRCFRWRGVNRPEREGGRLLFCLVTKCGMNGVILLHVRPDVRWWRGA
jgi:hypothetical protein